MPRLNAAVAGVLLGILVIAASPAAAPAAPSAKLAEARDAFRRGDYSKAVPRLTQLLYPKPQLSRRSELAEVHLMLAVCYFETGNREEAGAEYERALEQQPDLQLDPLFVTEEAVEFFKERKREFDKQAALDAEKRRLAEENALLRNAYERGLVRERRPYYVNFLPFGAGQYQNGDNTKGVFISAIHGATAAAATTIFLYHAAKYGLGGAVPREEAGDVRRLQQVQIGLGVGFFGVWLYGVIDSLMHYKHEVPVEFDPSLLKELGTAPTKKTGLRLYPTPMPAGAGLTLSLDF